MAQGIDFNAFLARQSTHNLVEKLFDAVLPDDAALVQFVVVPQACFDAAVGAGLLWLLEQRFALPRFGMMDRYS